LSAIDVLQDAKELVREGWSQGAFARNSRGDPVGVMSAEAIYFDVSGAIARAAYGWELTRGNASHAFQECIKESIPVWQDSVSLAEVLACFDETIATLRSREEGYEFG
jgi:hypothetical protein